MPTQPDTGNQETNRKTNPPMARSLEQPQVQIVKPQVQIVGHIDNIILIQTSWEEKGKWHRMSSRTLGQIAQIGILVIDDPNQYLQLPNVA